MKKHKPDLDGLDPLTRSGNQAIGLAAVGRLWWLTLAGLLLLQSALQAQGQEFIAGGEQPLYADEEASLAPLVAAGQVAQGCRCGCASRRPCIQAACWFGGVDYLWVRPHFSEAVAFARGSQTATTYQTVAEGLEFDHDSSFRAFAGFRLADGRGAIRLNYWNLDGETTVGGTDPGPGQFLVDPFGNVVGVAFIVDPGHALAPGPIIGGAAITTQASVAANVYDIDFTRSYRPTNLCWDLEWSVGVRIADIDQFYESIITDAAGALFSRGDFIAEFMGAGPRVGVESRRYFGRGGCLSLFASSHMALILGQYDVQSSNSVTSPVPFQASQSETMTRIIPVLETELGVARQIHSSINLSLGWLFQAWFDLGTSGGTFGGFFAGTDDANIMSFDGLVARAEVAF